VTAADQGGVSRVTGAYMSNDAGAVRPNVLRSFTDVDEADAPEAMHEFLDGVNALPEFRRYRDQLRTSLALRPGHTLLDVGCGVGAATRWLARQHPEVHVVGLDRAAMVTEAAQRGGRLGVQVRWLTGDAEAIPLRDASMDACMTDRVLKYLPDPARGIAEMVRVLRPGGRIASFELDCAATVLTGDPAIRRSGDPATAELARGQLCASVGEPRMGRLLPEMLRAAGLVDLTFRPVAFHLPLALNEALPARLARRTCYLRAMRRAILRL
jgi:SAM-dependent methyltransferase